VVQFIDNGEAVELRNELRDIGLLQVPCHRAATVMRDWTLSVYKESGFQIEFTSLSGSIHDLLDVLYCYENSAKRCFLLTTCMSGWTGLFANGQFGIEEGPIMVMGEYCDCLSIRAVLRQTKKQTYPASMFSLFKSGKHVRSVWAMNDGGRWDFGAFGDPLEFERLDQYTVKPIRKRLTDEMVIEYVEQLSAYPLRSEWYREDRHALISIDHSRVFGSRS
jgi:hypothetical protein